VATSTYIPANALVVTVECWRAYAYQLGIADGEARAQQKAFKERKDQRDI
jgi:hypothetical protein